MDGELPSVWMWSRVFSKDGQSGKPFCKFLRHAERQHVHIVVRVHSLQVLPVSLASSSSALRCSLCLCVDGARARVSRIIITRSWSANPFLYEWRVRPRTLEGMPWRREELVFYCCGHFGKHISYSLDWNTGFRLTYACFTPRRFRTTTTITKGKVHATVSYARTLRLGSRIIMPCTCRCSLRGNIRARAEPGNVLPNSEISTVANSVCPAFRCFSPIFLCFSSHIVSAF